MVVPGNNHRNIREEGRERCGLTFKQTRRFNMPDQTKFSCDFLCVTVHCGKERKEGTGEARYCINSGGRCGGVALANGVGWSDHCLL